MAKYIIKRILLMIPVLLGVSILVFLLQVFTPGDPADIALGHTASKEAVYEWKEQYGLNDSIVVQYGHYMWKLITKGDMGISYRTGTSINTELSKRWPISFKMAIIATCIASAIGIPLGIVSAKNRGKFLDAFARLFGIAGISIPVFWLAFLFVMLFSIQLKLLPVSGLFSLKHWVLPSVTIGIVSSASILRVTRSSVLDNISADYVRTARAKGQTEKVIMRHHILRNSLIPIVTSVVTQFAAAIGSSAVVETVFVVNGMGNSTLSAINNRDFALLRACVLLIAVAVCVINLLADLSFTLIDPRVKSRFSNSVKRAKKISAKGGCDS
ncbi:Glutathione transport system permease protein gsiC [uncultured Clostridium sp.]|nr:Glutathione transport system permease protein gsiC [uncultured Clostridium sp.]